MPPEGSGCHYSPSQQEGNVTPSDNDTVPDITTSNLLRGSSPSKRPASDMDNDDVEMRESIETEHAGSTNAYLAAAGGNQYLDAGRHQRPSSADMSGQNQADGMTASNSAKSTSGSGSGQPSSIATSMESSPFHATAPTDGRVVEDDMPFSSRPSFDQQWMEIVAGNQRELKDGDVGFVVSTLWLQRIQARTSQPPSDVDKTAAEGAVGPIDNSSIKAPPPPINSLLDEGKPSRRFHPLLRELRIEQDYEIVPEDVWQKLVLWYGQKDDASTIRRFAHDTADPDSAVSNLQYEVHPPIFTLRRVRKKPDESHTDLAPILLSSRNQKAQNFLKTIKSKLTIPMDSKVRVWRVLAQSANASASKDMMTPPDSDDEVSRPQPATREKKFINRGDFDAMEAGTQKAELEDLHDQLSHASNDGSATVGMLGLGEDQTLILEEEIHDGSNKTVGAATKNLQARKPNASNRVSPAPSGAMTRGRTQRTGRGRGTVGLQNLGNTCYMNSALQCIRSVEELSQYFLSDQWKKELNPGNPLGHSGNVAKAYASLISSLYDPGVNSSFAPRNFKQTLGRYAPMFSGYGQQDSQEFMSFLVDGLHEDLNRIHKKPYTENPESDDKTIGDPEAIRALGEKFRENHRARNDSIAMDLFNGFYKNTMVCPECDKVSITFDPYSLLTLQLPFQQTWQHVVWFMPLYAPPVAVAVDMDKNGSIRGLKDYIIARVPGLERDKLLVTEIFNNKFYKIFEDNAVISESSIQTNDKIAVYELEAVPTNWPPKKKPSKPKSAYTYSYGPDESEEEPTSEAAERMLVPIFNQMPSNSSYSSSKNLTLWPLFVSLTPEEAKDYDTVLRKVLARVATMTTNQILKEEHVGAMRPLPSKTSSDGVVTTDDDASSSLDSTVQAESVADDRSLVDVSMVNGTEGAPRNGDALDTDLPGAKYHPPPPAILTPGSWIDGRLQDLFDMRRYHVGKQIIPAGMTYGFDKTTLLRRRDPPPATEERRSSVTSSTTAAESLTSDSDGEDVDDRSETVHSFQANDNDDAQSLPDVAELMNRKSKGHAKHANKKKRPQGLMTYSRKGKHTPQQKYGFDGASEATEEESDELLQLGDVLVVDWNSDAHDMLFGGRGKDDLKGVDTLSKSALEVLDDPALKAKQAKRIARKKAGVSLEDCFAETSKSEILSEDNAWYCGRCKEMRRASKALEIWTLPEILVVHLKRFGSNSRMRDKLDVLVDFPIEGLDLNERVGLPEGKTHLYDLIAVDNHYGGLGGGHYTAYAKNFVDQKWYNFDDSSVSEVSSPERVITPAAYLLFYRRRSPKPLGPEYLQHLVEISHKDDDDETIDDADTEADGSRNASPSGQGKGLRGGSYPSGSPSASAGVGAGRLARTGALVGLRGGRESPVRTEEDETMQEADEGYGSDGYGEAGFIGPQQPITNIADIYKPLWNFNNASQRDLATGGDDADSNQAMGSDAGADVDDDDLNERLLNEADDEHFQQVPPIQVSPNQNPFEDDTAIEDLPTQDIHLEPDVEDALDNDATDFQFRSFQH